jgi:hypothetical protein
VQRAAPPVERADHPADGIRVIPARQAAGGET